MSMRQPALFIGHGSPMTMITDNPERHALARLGKALAGAPGLPRAVLCISAHWETRGQIHITAPGHPDTIHDFRGFPQELSDWRYPAPSPAWLVDRVAGLLGRDRVRPDAGWGYDHGTWGVIDLLFPGEYLPTVAMSLDRGLSAAGHLALGRELALLRDEGVMIVGSGNVVHNIALYGRTTGTVPDWADSFRSRITAAITAGDEAALTRFAADDEEALKAINSAEHYLPLLYAVGASLPGDAIGVFNDSVDGSLSMTSYLFGEPDALRAHG